MSQKVTIEGLQSKVSECTKFLEETALRAAHLGTLYGAFEVVNSRVRSKLPEPQLVYLLRSIGIDPYDEEQVEMPVGEDETETKIVRTLKPLDGLREVVTIAHQALQAERDWQIRARSEVARTRRSLRRAERRKVRTFDAERYSGVRIVGGGCNSGPKSGMYDSLEAFSGRGGSRKAQPQKKEKKSRGKRSSFGA
ncbi:MAG: hypothetical protein AAB897_01410 [Patescibacteria group bacterium]